MIRSIPARITLLIATLLPISFSAHAQQAASSLAGFRYGREVAPSGKEWESPDDLSLNKEQPRAYFFSFDDVAHARKVLPENSKYWMSLDGTWKFNWVKTPEQRPRNFFDPKLDVSSWDEVPVPMNWNILGIQKDASLKYGVPIYVNQPVIFQHSVKVDDWRGGVMRTPPEHWTAYIYRNEVGSYRRTFSVPSSWDGREIFVNFDGVDSFFYLWINGKYVGFSKNSRNAASFDITSYLNKSGENTIAVEVYRNSDASFLEAQDMFRLPGIFRTVSLTSKPKIHVRDLIAIPDLDANYENGSLQVKADIRNLDKKDAKDYKMVYSLYANELYGDSNTAVGSTAVVATAKEIKAGGFASTAITFPVSDPNKWSAERPYRYTLVGELKDNKNRTVETVSVVVGFRKVEIKDTKAEDDEFGLAGRYFYINGKAVKLKGVNRHETNPETGKVISREQMENEIKLMKRANINHVRNSHYPDDPYWYYLCNKYGIYLEDEANIESHQYYYGDASLSHPVEWRNAHVARNVEMVHATINNPSVVIWSLGNEAGPGKNFVAAYEAIKQIDTSRPVQYERNNSIVDMGSNQYPSIDWVRGAVKGTYKIKYPFHISEYAHSMGNAAGNLVDYWEAIESTNYFMGGAIWDWIDQSMYYYDKATGEKYLAYGGDFGDKPNDGTFVMNGLIFADMTPKPQYYEVKKVYQNVGVRAVDIKQGKIEVFNKNYFVPLSDYTMQWSLYKDGIEIEKSTTFEEDNKITGARQRKQYTIPFDFSALDPQSEYFVKIQFLLSKDEFWAEIGFVQMEEQLLVKEAENRPLISAIAKGGTIQISSEGDFKTIKSDGFTVRFDTRTGTIYSLTYGNEQIIRDGEGPKLDALRAPLDNDNWAYQQWFKKGLHNLKHKTLSTNTYTKPDGSVVLSFSVESQAPHGATIRGGSSGTYTITEHMDRPFSGGDFKFTATQIWTVYRDGSIELQSSITSNNAALVLPHIGYTLQVPEKYGNFQYYGRGPVNNYVDRKTAQSIELYKSTVKEQYVAWPNPQSTGNREEVRWSSLTDDSGNGAIFIANKQMATSALPWSELEMTLAPHTYQLPTSTGTHLSLNAAVTGLGGNSCGQGPPLEKDRVKADAHTFGFIIRPVKGNDCTVKAGVSPAGDRPLTMSRSRNGDISISTEKNNAAIYYAIGNDKPRLYTSPFNLRSGGKVSAWLKENEKLAISFDFEKIESIAMTVVFSSSEERGEGNASHLVDGDLSTIWHTMYSVTVAQYPHWVDFDAGDVKTIKGFTYTPRQDGPNGNIKEYKLQVSTDGKNWSDSIIEGKFENNFKPKSVTLRKPIKGRFIRFTALSSQSGQDFASGAEFAVMAE
ncbi:glycoside hydrolase family 2 TIM barrel-domain containing protein [Sphingobacterium pedocola]|uniref:beta-galactosidase n=1 Tax=Sphingobacterium pedocola TaxID=2082722 RepID=A0ABR9TF23_9SPHI|nr:glycoside hydrolase family 2 TIM barrel-domain containing protein [Sphingobacterium pedocola]MBE8723277.1 beta-galactosidase [Sphingobacterium pedocola]